MTLPQSESRKPMHLFDQLAKSRWSYLVVALCICFWIAVATARRGIPAPSIHDEFSFIFGADTFLQGHLTNPTHPFWRHFETFHVLSQPTWMTKYQPAQPLVLAGAKLLFGQYIFAVWLSSVAAAVATLWAMRAYLSPRYAFALCLLFTADPVGPFSWTWNMGYVPTGIPALAGALLIGSIRRIARDARRWDALLLGIGISLFLLSRPFEGGQITLAALVTLTVHLYRERSTSQRTIRVLAWALPPLFAAITFQAIYNNAVTNSPLRIPYLVHYKQYDAVPGLLIMRQPERHTYNYDILTRFYDIYQKEYKEKQTFKGRISHLRSYLSHQLFIPYFDPRLLTVLILLFSLGLLWTFLVGDWWQRAMVLCLVFFDSVLSLSMYFSMHYVAPAMPLFCVVLGMFVTSLPTLRSRNRRFWIGTLIALTGVLLILLPYKRNMLIGWLNKASGAPGHTDLPWNYVHANIESHVAKSGKKILILVRYNLGQSPHQDWVANHSPVDAAPVIWARSLTPDEDARLLAYYSSRELWGLTVGPRPGEEWPGQQFPKMHQLYWTNLRTQEGASPWFTEASLP